MGSKAESGGIHIGLPRYRCNVISLPFVLITGPETYEFDRPGSLVYGLNYKGSL